MAYGLDMMAPAREFPSVNGRLASRPCPEHRRAANRAFLQPANPGSQERRHAVRLERRRAARPPFRAALATSSPAAQGQAVVTDDIALSL